MLRDTYPEIGWRGYHLQPAEAVAFALKRHDGKEGGVLCVCGEDKNAQLKRRLLEGVLDPGYEIRHWDNGSRDADEA